MLLLFLFANTLPSIVFSADESFKQFKPYATLPLPLLLPERNDRSEQCWLRVEDVELTATITVYCYMAHAFLRDYIHDYNYKWLTEDDVDVSLWSEEPRGEEIQYPSTKPSERGKKTMKDWKVTTIMDTITHMRLYVSQNADCRLIMYSREGMSNYKLNCERVLYFFNTRTSNSAVFPREQVKLYIIVIIFLLLTV